MSFNYVEDVIEKEKFTSIQQYKLKFSLKIK